jgi:hypothetical protein
MGASLVVDRVLPNGASVPLSALLPEKHSYNPDSGNVQKHSPAFSPACTSDFLSHTSHTAKVLSI